MFKIPVTYTDYNGNERSEDFYFNLTQAEVTEMELTTQGGLADKIQTIINAQDVPTMADVHVFNIDGPTIIMTFKDLVLRSYGRKSADGRRFEKSQELRDAFEQSEPYSIIFMQLATDPDAAAAFVNGITPKFKEPVSKPLPVPSAE